MAEVSANEIAATSPDHTKPISVAVRCAAPLFRQESTMGRGILLWLLGVPIPIIILLALFSH